MGELEGAETLRQPMRREGRDRADHKHALGIDARLGEGRAQQLEGLGGARRKAASGLGERDLARKAQEEGRANPLLQQLDLIADRSLRHAELVRGPGEAQMPRRRLEGADGGEGWERVRRHWSAVWDKSALCMMIEFRLDYKP